ncbi:hypothetical protein Z517_02322 [Fonsecaea pedrosoi CBS 271.37]|uniref:Cytochrome P450 n=1 Tax=Fonsecaea pedrosoi CBS 271.37 TaxID=1442368 RepID=A0A0D2HF89_9EURO|nr:uncharacterized protein Z517_02322 [Fonsecaea pedrosoi CBS 271.37]KIW83079.1 hypothetical protein Z517_02322 [Fonsecaea pedrosoi CBS 271.37]
MSSSPASQGSTALTLIPLMFAGCVVSYLVGIYRSYQTLSHFKGPPLAVFTSLWLASPAINARMPTPQKETLKKYGPSLLVTDDPELLGHMSALRSKWTRSSWYEGMKLVPRANNIFSERDERRHAEMRSKTIGAVNPPELYAFPITLVLMVLIVLTGDKYSRKEVDTLESDFDEKLQRLQALIRREYNGKPLDVSLVASLFTLDVLSQIAFGDAFGFVAAKRDLSNFNESANQFFKVIELILNHDTLRTCIQSRSVQKILAPKGTDEFGLGRIIGIAQKAVAERYRPDPKTQAEAESHLQIIAGSDSTSSALRITMMLLIGSPVAYQKVVTEIDRGLRAAKSPTQSSGTVRPPSWRIYLPVSGKVSESSPPLFGLLSKLAPPEGDTVNEVFFPLGTEVAFCCEGIGQGTDIFGADADLYRLIDDYILIRKSRPGT